MSGSLEHIKKAVSLVIGSFEMPESVLSVLQQGLDTAPIDNAITIWKTAQAPIRMEFSVKTSFAEKLSQTVLVQRIIDLVINKKPLSSVMTQFLAECYSAGRASALCSPVFLQALSTHPQSTELRNALFEEHKKQKYTLVLSSFTTEAPQNTSFNFDGSCHAAKAQHGVPTRLIAGVPTHLKAYDTCLARNNQHIGIITLAEDPSFSRHCESYSSRKLTLFSLTKSSTHAALSNNTNFFAIAVPQYEEDISPRPPRSIHVYKIQKKVPPASNQKSFLFPDPAAKVILELPDEGLHEAALAKMAFSKDMHYLAVVFYFPRLGDWKTGIEAPQKTLYYRLPKAYLEESLSFDQLIFMMELHDHASLNPYDLLMNETLKTFSEPEKEAFKEKIKQMMDEARDFRRRQIFNIPADGKDEKSGFESSEETRNGTDIQQADITSIQQAFEFPRSVHIHFDPNLSLFPTPERISVLERRKRNWGNEEIFKTYLTPQEAECLKGDFMAKISATKSYALIQLYETLASSLKKAYAKHPQASGSLLPDLSEEDQNNSALVQEITLSLGKQVLGLKDILSEAEFIRLMFDLLEEAKKPLPIRAGEEEKLIRAAVEMYESQLRSMALTMPKIEFIEKLRHYKNARSEKPTESSSCQPLSPNFDEAS